MQNGNKAGAMNGSSKLCSPEHLMLLTRSIRNYETSIDFVQGPPIGSRKERVKICCREWIVWVRN